MVLNQTVTSIESAVEVKEATYSTIRTQTNFMVGVEKHFGRRHMTINQLFKRIEARQGTNEYLFAFSGPQVVGQAFVEEKINAFWQIGGVYTLPSARGNGIGRQLVSTLSEKIQSTGNIPILAVLKDNHSAVHVYETLGFEKVADFSIINIEF
jgi:predicted GNAT family acetyltransferase